jgi:hypothetical protein
MYGIENPRTYLNQWIQNIKAFGVDRLIIIDNTEFKLSNYYTHRDSTFLFEKYNTLEECLEIHSGEMWVVLEALQTFIVHNIEPTSIQNLTHPIDNVMYLFGPDFGSISYESILNKKMAYITMNDNHPLYAISACSVVLHDRLVKQLNK